MTGIERVAAAAAFEKPDRTPVVGQVFGHAAVLAEVPLSEYLQDGELLARCQVGAWERYGYDACFALMDVSVETEALGSTLDFAEDRYPVVKTYAVPADGDLTSIEVPDPNVAGRMPELLRAASILRREVGPDAAVVGCVCGPMTLATQLMGVEAALELAIEAPRRFGKVLDLAVETATAFGVAQIEAGVHLPIVFDPSSSPALVPPQFFREFVAPRARRLFRHLREAGATGAWLHIAGEAAPIMRYYGGLGVTIANCDYCVSPAEAVEALPGVCINGNLKPLLFLTAGPEEIRSAARELLRAFSLRGGFILSPGCEVPLDAKPENVAALVESVG